MSAAAPAISVVVVTAGPWDRIDRTVRHLRAQTIRDRIELVLVAPAGALEPLPAAVEGFAAWRRAETPLRTTGAALAAGASAATAPVVAYAEEHAYPEPGWAAALVEAHRGPWAGVGCALANANPWSATSWAHLILAFGPFVGATAGGERRDLPWHQVAYKREALLAHADRLEEMLEVEGRFQATLRAEGGRFSLEPAAVTRHVNASRAGSYLSTAFLDGLLSGVALVEQAGGTLASRALRVAKAPLVPAVRLARLAPDLRRARLPAGMLARVVPMLVAGLGLHALGEAVGAVRGAGDAAERLLDVETHRENHVTESDRRALAAAFDG